MKNGMELFLSDGAIREHREYLADLKHKASVLRKSGLDLERMANGERCALRLSVKERSDTEKLLNNIKQRTRL